MDSALLPGNPRLVECETDDGIELHGLWIPGSKFPAVDAAIVLPGVGGNFYASRLCRRMASHLHTRGCSVLLGNTRGHDTVAVLSGSSGTRWGGAAFEIVAECVADVQAWQRCVLEWGGRSVLLVGHSLGAVKALYVAARSGQADRDRCRCRGVVAISPPRLNHRAIARAPEAEAFLQSYHEALLRKEQGRGEEPFFVSWPFRTLMTPHTFLDKYGPASRYDFLRWLPRLSLPALFVYGERELSEGGAAFSGIDGEITSRRPGPHVALRIVEGADHFYRGVEQELMAVVSDWLDAVPPGSEFANDAEPVH